jgi:hypothetical protein
LHRVNLRPIAGSPKGRSQARGRCLLPGLPGGVAKTRCRIERTSCALLRSDGRYESRAPLPISRRANSYQPQNRVPSSMQSNKDLAWSRRDPHGRPRGRPTTSTCGSPCGSLDSGSSWESSIYAPAHSTLLDGGACGATNRMADWANVLVSVPPLLAGRETALCRCSPALTSPILSSPPS